MQQCGDERGKLFVGGLSWETTHSSMLKFFSRYGEVIDCVVMKNPGTGKSRGFGFITFKDPACVEMVLSSTPHILDGRQIDPKACNPRSLNKGGKNLENSKKKIFIGGLPTNITDVQLREQFSKYGNVLDVVIMVDQEKQKSRGFGFITFETEESVDAVVGEHFIEVNGKQVEVKKAEPRDLKMIADNASSMWTLGSNPYGSGGAMMVYQARTPLTMPTGSRGMLSSMGGLGRLYPSVGATNWCSTPSPTLRVFPQSSPQLLLIDPGACSPVTNGITQFNGLNATPTNGIASFNGWSSSAVPVSLPALFDRQITESAYAPLMTTTNMNQLYTLNSLSPQPGFTPAVSPFNSLQIDASQSEKSLTYHLSAIGGYSQTLARSVFTIPGSGAGVFNGAGTTPLGVVTAQSCGNGVFLSPSAGYGKFAASTIQHTITPAYHPYRR